MSTENTPAQEQQATPMSTAKVFENGPVRVIGPTEVLLPDGTTVIKPNGISFCRCGASANMPFCDASHKTNGFQSK